MKTLIARQLKNEAFRNKLIVLINPFSELGVGCLSKEQVSRDVHRRDAVLVYYNRPQHVEKCRSNPLSEQLVPGESPGVTLPFFKNLNKRINFLA